MQAQENIQEAANKHYLSRFDDELRGLVELYDGQRESAEYDGETYTDTDEALETLEEMPLSVGAVSTDWREESTEWEILLGTGGPADRVLVTTDFQGRIESATYQHQDWFQPWTDAENQDTALVTRFAEIVGYFDEQPGETSGIDRR